MLSTTTCATLLCASLLTGSPAAWAKNGASANSVLPTALPGRADNAVRIADADALASEAMPHEAIWQEIEAKAGASDADFKVKEGFYKTYFMNADAMGEALASAPKSGSDAAKVDPLIMSIPMHDGSFMRFRVVESALLSPETAADHPEIKTYRGYGIDDPTAVMCCDLTPAGFRAMIVSDSGSFFVDPLRLDDPSVYVSYDKRGYEGSDPFVCDTTGAVDDLVESVEPRATKRKGSVSVSSGAAMRVYRLSIACTSEYSVWQTANTPGGPAVSIAQTINRVNLVYNVDLAINFVLVLNPLLMHLVEPDGFTNGNVDAMIAENQTQHNALNMNLLYEVGHVFGRANGGGLAELASASRNGVKARGVTCRNTPKGDPFDVDYVSHELGHQFGADHTFNSTSGGCGGGNRVLSSAFEPGSGSTIMSYASLCSPDNVQGQSDDYFHIRSLEQIVTYTTVGLGKPFLTAPAVNTVPSVNAGFNVKIPRDTPFTLTATGIDGNGDALTYCWEEFDLGTTAKTMPLFRSQRPAASASRDFPKLADLWAGTPSVFEALPTVDRLMKFRCTVRDGKGGIFSDETIVTVQGSPFALTSPNVFTMWKPSSTQTVTWTVENPKIAQSVDIWFWNGDWTLLESGVPNDGSESIVVPNKPFATCRILVQAVGQVFYDISNADVMVTAPALLSESFEGAAAGWLATGTGSVWKNETATGHTGTHRFAAGSPTYVNLTNTSLTSPTFSLAGKSTAALSFFFAHKTEQDFDKFWVEVTKNNGETWTKVDVTRSGTSAGFPNWVPTVVDLTPFVGSSQCKVRFRFNADKSNTSFGVVIDDVDVIAQ